MKRTRTDRLLTAFQVALLCVFAALFLLKACTSLVWRMEFDTPLLHYAAFLMDQHGMVPYLDVFETSMPATFAFHYLIGSLFGYGDVAFRLVDLTLLGALIVATYAFMVRFGRGVAIWAVTLFGLVYFALGQIMSLQRDYIGILPIVFALWCIPAKTDTPVRLARFAFIGLLFGVAVLIKPHLGIALPVVFGALLAFRWQSKKRSAIDLCKCAAVCGSSLLAPASIAVVWLAANSALGSFASILFNYLPLHTAMTGSHETIAGMDRVLYLMYGLTKLGGFGGLVLCALFAYYHVVTHADDKEKGVMISLTCLGLCTLAYAVYPALAGKFWGYHYMPLAFFSSISAALCFFTRPQPSESLIVSRTKRVLLLSAVVIAVTVRLPLSEYVFSLVADLRSGAAVTTPKLQRVDEIAGWLKTRLRPGDTVQPLDWTGGSVHGLLLAEAKLATQFMYDYHFYHHVSSPFVQGLRQLFMRQLRDASPRFIIEVITEKPWVSGKDTTREFPELRQFLEDHYAVACQGDGYLILKKTQLSQVPQAQQSAPPDGPFAPPPCAGTMGRPDTTEQAQPMSGLMQNRLERRGSDEPRFTGENVG